ncbi:MAG: BCCT family transporter [Synergistales bacterium]|nr:BCCT family transporter [Synergistales bacterium]
MQSRSGGLNAVFVIAPVITVGVVLWGLFSPETFSGAANGTFNFLIANMGWSYMLSMSIFVVFLLFMGLGPFGKVKLGPPDSTPEFSNVSWFAMLFSAGMGIGLVFYGIGEPMYHFMSPPVGPGETPEAAMQAMQISFLHWGIHPWASYGVIALSLAFFQFRKNAPGLISSVFLPILGEKGVRGPIGKTIDVLAIFATVAGIATSLGLGTLQIGSGLEYLFSIPNSIMTQLMIIVVIGLIYTGSAVTGIEKGIKFISTMNLYIALFLLGAFFLIGPTVKSLMMLLTSMGYYFNTVIQESLKMTPFGGALAEWQGAWTLFYWAWWIAWAPFVGTFIARISRGRTVREFVFGVLLVPCLGSFCWFAVFGTSAMNLELAGIAEVGQVIVNDISTGLFEVFQYYPLGMLLSLAALVLISTFFITSANSATFVLSMYSSQGNLNPPKGYMAIWGTLQAALAFTLLLTGGLKALQIASIAAAFPFEIVMLFACYSLYRGLQAETMRVEPATESPTI